MNAIAGLSQGRQSHGYLNELNLIAATDYKLVYASIIATVAKFSLNPVEGINEIVVERDNANAAAAAQVPPVLPVELCEMTPRKFAAALTLQKPRLLQHFSEQEFNDIDRQYRDLCLRYKEEEPFCLHLKLNSEKHNKDRFKKLWNDVGNGYELLRECCGGLASVMAGTASVESDFSKINWTKDAHSISMTDFTLESILHCKQHNSLVQLFKNKKHHLSLMILAIIV